MEALLRKNEKEISGKIRKNYFLAEGEKFGHQLLYR